MFETIEKVSKDRKMKKNYYYQLSWNKVDIRTTIYRASLHKQKDIKDAIFTFLFLFIFFFFLYSTGQLKEWQKKTSATEKGSISAVITKQKTVQSIEYA